MIRAIFFDIDGTLLSFNTHKMPETTIEALNELRSKGIKLFIATGRHKSDITTVDKYFKFDAHITLNGQFCFNENETIYKKSINKKDIESVVKHAKQGLYSCYFIDENELFVNRLDDDVKQFCDKLNLNVPKECDPSVALDRDIYQLLALLNKENEYLLINDTSEVDATRWHHTFIDVVPKGGSKRVGIEKILKCYGISKEEIMAFGDGENDIEMLKFAKIGVAMGNASDQVKQLSDYVTSHIDDDGIMKALKYFNIL